MNQAEAIDWWATVGEAKLHGWTKDASRLVRAVANELAPATPFMWRTRYVPVADAASNPKMLSSYYDPNMAGHGAVPILPHAYASMNEAARVYHGKWGISLLDWGRALAGLTGWYHVDGLHQHEWVSRTFAKVLFNAMLAARDERALASCT